jgi:hypothetical protein
MGRIPRAGTSGEIEILWEEQAETYSSGGKGTPGQEDK